jgi:hypothetical protein
MAITAAIDHPALINLAKTGPEPTVHSPHAAPTTVPSDPNPVLKNPLAQGLPTTVPSDPNPALKNPLAQGLPTTAPSDPNPVLKSPLAQGILPTVLSGPNPVLINPLAQGILPTAPSDPNPALKNPLAQGILPTVLSGPNPVLINPLAQGILPTVLSDPNPVLKNLSGNGVPKTAAIDLDLIQNAKVLIPTTGTDLGPTATAKDHLPTAPTGLPFQKNPMVRGIPKTGKNDTVDFLRTPMGVQHAQPMHLHSQGRPTIRRKEPAKRNQNESTPGKAQKTAKAAQNEAQGLISK